MKLHALKFLSALNLPLISLLFIFSCSHSGNNNLSDKIICLDPGHGGTAGFDSFRVGPTGEREEWINLRVALEIKSLLEKSGSTVILTRTQDKPMGLKDRARMAVENNADVFISIHHNATADANVNFPIVYFHGNASENQASVQLGECLINQILIDLYQTREHYSLVSDYTIFPRSGTAVLRHSYGIPGIIGEASFFTHPAEEKRLKSHEYNYREAEAYVLALKNFFALKKLPIIDKSFEIQLPPFPVLQESDRMNPLALLWQDDFYLAKSLLNFHQKDSLQKSLDLFSRSISSFPDSWLARDAHIYRAEILEKQQKLNEAQLAKKRVDEYYIRLK